MCWVTVERGRVANWKPDRTVQHETALLQSAAQSLFARCMRGFTGSDGVTWGNIMVHLLDVGAGYVGVVEVQLRAGFRHQRPLLALDLQEA